MVPLVPEEFSVAALRLLYDVSFFIIVTTIGLNIVFGIIVDTFSELRDERVCSILVTALCLCVRRLVCASAGIYLEGGEHRDFPTLSLISLPAILH